MVSNPVSYRNCLMHVNLIIILHHLMLFLAFNIPAMNIESYYICEWEQTLVLSSLFQ